MFKAALLQFSNQDRRIFWVCAALLMLSLLAYAYFLSISVYAVIVRKSAEQQSKTLNARISQLESQYAVADKDIDLAFAHEHGFLDIGVPKYLTGVKTTDALSLRTDTNAE